MMVVPACSCAQDRGHACARQAGRHAPDRDKRWGRRERAPSTSFQTCTSGTPSAAPSTVAVRSLPPRPSVVIAPARGPRRVNDRVSGRGHVGRPACGRRPGPLPLGNPHHRAPDAEHAHKGLLAYVHAWDHVHVRGWGHGHAWAGSSPRDTGAYRQQQRAHLC